MSEDEPGRSAGSPAQGGRFLRGVALAAFALIVLVGAPAAQVGPADVLGIGMVFAAGTGLICAACYGGTKPTLCDPGNIRNHWRGHLRNIAAITAVGMLYAALVGLLR